MPAGTILRGKYLIGRVLGSGGFGITYLGMDLNKETPVAVKEYMPRGLSTRFPGQTDMEIIRSQKTEFDYGVKRFLEEAETIHEFRHHPNIVHVYSFFYENHTAYYIMELLQGKDFRSVLIQKGGKVTYRELMTVMNPVMDGLEYVHAKGIIHRDISPDNIHVGETVKLIDFGAARYAVANQSKSLDIIMKEGFAPEEQYRSHGRQGPWTDVYALCATMYVSLSGKMPPKAPDRLNGVPLEPVRIYVPQLPEHVSRAIMNGLALKAEDRIGSVGELRSALEGQGAAGKEKKHKIACFHLTGMAGYYAGNSLTVSDQIVIGRSAKHCGLLYPDHTPEISRIHCVIQIDRGRNLVFVEDQQSTFGTWVNGKRLENGMKAAVNTGDFISLGKEQVFQIAFE